MRRGFLRWRKRDSLLPFWKRKILLSARTKILPCGHMSAIAQPHVFLHIAASLLLPSPRPSLPSHMYLPAVNAALFVH